MSKRKRKKWLRAISQGQGGAIVQQAEIKGSSMISMKSKAKSNNNSNNKLFMLLKTKKTVCLRSKNRSKRKSQTTNKINMNNSNCNKKMNSNSNNKNIPLEEVMHKYIYIINIKLIRAVLIESSKKRRIQ